ncbi:MAG: winged helix-turn-helix transcriptional regulator [Deltaproteobacteria bacterium]|nr:winged helix-turn-helix transcriptional regulator [Deltaproteobacteria bacterium]
MDDIFQLHAAFCRVFSDPKRLRIMWSLQEGEKTVSNLAEIVGCSLPNISQHLRIMRQQGMLLTRRQGRSIFYRIANPKFLDGCMMVREGLVEELEKRGVLSTVDEVVAPSEKAASASDG